MKSYFILFISVLLSGYSLNAQLYVDGVAAGVRDAEALKAVVKQFYPGAGTSWTLERRKVDPRAFGGIGQAINEFDPCDNGVWGCTYVVKRFDSEASANVVLWSHPDVQGRIDYLWSRKNESDYWAGIYDGFLMRWFFSDFE